MCQQCATCSSHQASTQAQLKHPLWHSADRSGLERRLGSLSPACGGAALSHLPLSRASPCSIFRWPGDLSTAWEVTIKANHGKLGCRSRQPAKCFRTEEGLCRQEVPPILSRAHYGSAWPGLRRSWTWECWLSPLNLVTSLGGRNAPARTCGAWTCTGGCTLRPAGARTEGYRFRHVPLKSGVRGHPVTGTELASAGQLGGSLTTCSWHQTDACGQRRLSPLFSPLGSLLLLVLRCQASRRALGNGGITQPSSAMLIPNHRGVGTNRVQFSLPIGRVGSPGFRLNRHEFWAQLHR